MVDEFRVHLVRDAVGGTAIFAGLYALAYAVEFPVLRVPGYLLVVGFGLVAAGFEFAGPARDVLLAAYLVGLGLASAVISRAVRGRVPAACLSGSRVAIAGALALLGGLSLVFALGVLLQTTQREPVLVTGAVGLLMLVAAGWLAGLFELALPGDD